MESIVKRTMRATPTNWSTGKFAGAGGYQDGEVEGTKDACPLARYPPARSPAWSPAQSPLARSPARSLLARSPLARSLLTRQTPQNS
jgi:hypothetical protein